MSSITFFFIFIIILAAILLVVNLIFAPHNPYKEKNSVFECGFHSFLGQNRSQFSISFFIFALLFLLFDIEILLVYPYVTSSNTNEKYGLIFLVIFFTLLTLGFVFELGKDALKIPSRQYSNIVKLNIKRLIQAVKFFHLYKIERDVSLSQISLHFLPLIIISGILNGLVTSCILINSSKKKLNLIKGTRRRIIKFKLSKFNFILWVAIFVLIVLSLIVSNYVQLKSILYISGCIGIISTFLLCSILTWHIINRIIKSNIKDTKKVQGSSEFKLILDLFLKNTRILRISFIIVIVLITIFNYHNNVDYSIMLNIFLLFGPECTIFFIKFISTVYEWCFGHNNGWVFMNNAGGGAGDGGGAGGAGGAGNGPGGGPNNGGFNNAAANNQPDDDIPRGERTSWFFAKGFYHPSNFPAIIPEIYNDDSEIFDQDIRRRVKNDLINNPEQAMSHIRRAAWNEYGFHSNPIRTGPYTIRDRGLAWQGLSDNTRSRQIIRTCIIEGINWHYSDSAEGPRYD